MIRVLLFFVLAQICCSNETESKIYGSWHSDAEATNAYLAKNAQMNEFQKKVFPVLFGRATITFNRDGTGFIEMTAAKFPKMDGTEIDVAASKTDFRFEILGEAKSQIVIRPTSEDDVFQDAPFAILTLHDEDTYSVSLSDGLAMINGREFFTRVKNNKSNKAEMATPRKPSD
jgi:hypothetical protein